MEHPLCRDAQLGYAAHMARGAQQPEDKTSSRLGQGGRAGMPQPCTRSKQPHASVNTSVISLCVCQSPHAITSCPASLFSPPHCHKLQSSAETTSIAEPAHRHYNSLAAASQIQASQDGHMKETSVQVWKEPCSWSPHACAHRLGPAVMMEAPPVPEEKRQVRAGSALFPMHLLHGASIPTISIQTRSGPRSHTQLLWWPTTPTGSVHC